MIQGERSILTVVGCGEKVIFLDINNIALL